MEALYGRQEEVKVLEGLYHSGKAEFIAVYGRRRVGKTYLIDTFFEQQYAFSVTGVIDGKRSEEMFVFTQSMRKIGYQGPMPKTWMEAFSELSDLLERKLVAKERMVLFIDELPCFDTPKAGFLRAFDHFWNSWGSKHKEVILIVCGSATTWMIDNLVDSHAGLHNRLTQEIHLHPFQLHETEVMLNAMEIGLDRLSILQLYMVLGGIPYYLSLLRQGESVIQAIDRLFFSENAPLRNEYARLFASLFRRPEPYLEIMRVLSAHRQGVTREEIATALGMHENGHLSDYLKNLIKCDFVRFYHMRTKNVKISHGLYQLTDFFVIFYNTFMRKDVTDEHYWAHHLLSNTANNWHGLAFERVCMGHIPQIKQALGITGIGTEYYSWRSKESSEGAQVDLILERADRVINLCEIKYSTEQYALDKDEDLKIRNRMGDFKAETETKYAVLPVLVSTYGMKRNSYSGGIHWQVTMDELFEKRV